MTTFPDGVFQYGGQPVGSHGAGPWSKVYFVDGAIGSDGHDGLKPNWAKATIGAATALATRGDVIYVRPKDYAIGHGMERYQECVTIGMTNTGYNYAGTTNYPLCTPSDISIIGVTNTISPEYGVRWRFDTTYCLINDSPALHVENIGFFAEDATAAVYLRCNGSTDTQRGMDGTTFYNCGFKGGAIYGASGGSGLWIERCHFYTKFDGTSAGLGAIKVTCSTNPGNTLRILDNIFHGGTTTEAPATCYITVLPPMSQCTIQDNTFGTIPTDGHFIDLSGAANTGQIVGNRFCGAITLEASLHIGGCIQAGNFEIAGFMG